MDPERGGGETVVPFWNHTRLSEQLKEAGTPFWNHTRLSEQLKEVVDQMQKWEKEPLKGVNMDPEERGGETVVPFWNHTRLSEQLKEVVDQMQNRSRQQGLPPIPPAQ